MTVDGAHGSLTAARLALLALCLAAACPRDERPDLEQRADAASPARREAPADAGHRGAASPAEAGAHTHAPAPPRAPVAPAPTAALAGGECTAGPPAVLGTAPAPVRTVEAEIGPEGGLVSWMSAPGELTVRQVDAQGVPVSEARTVPMEQATDVVALWRRGDGTVIAAAHGRGRIVMVALGPDGAPRGAASSAALRTCAGLVCGLPMWERMAMPYDHEARGGYLSFPIGDDLLLVCPDHDELRLERTRLGAGGVVVDPHLTARMRTIKEVALLGVRAFAVGGSFVVVTEIWDEDYAYRGSPRTTWLVPAGLAPLAWNPSLNHQTWLEAVATPLRDVFLGGDTLHLVAGRDEGPFLLHRYEIDGDLAAPAETLDPAALPEVLADRLVISLEAAADQPLRLARHDAIGRPLGEPVEVGPIALPRPWSRTIGHAATWRWTGRAAVVAWPAPSSAGSHTTTEITTRAIACPR